MNIKKLLLLGALVSVSNQLSAQEHYANYNSCQARCYECSCNPLYCGAWSVQFQAGVAPILWHKRGELDILSCTSSPDNPIISLASSLPKFSRLYRVPWYIGGKVGYDYTDNMELYFEFDYLQAKRKNNDNSSFSILSLSPAQVLQLTLGKYKLFEGYVGARYYWDRWCDRVAFFLGAKVGFTAHRKTSLALALNGTPISVVPTPSCPGTLVGSTDNNFFSHSTNISGGLNAGFDICFCGNWSLVLTGEFVASCGPRSVTTLVFGAATAAPLFATGLIIGGIYTELRFPVTAGVRYTF